MRIIIGSIFLFNFLFSQGFLHVENGEIVDGSSIPVLLRGLGLGGWLVPEGYMLNIPGFGSPTEIENKFEALLGTELANEFWDLYHDGDEDSEITFDNTIIQLKSFHNEK